MAIARKKEILFVFEGPKSRSQRDRELEVAAIRSHAARNARRKKQIDTRESALVVKIDETVPDPPSPTLPIQRPPKLPPIPVLLTWTPVSSRSPSEKGSQTDDTPEKWAEAPSALSLLGQGRVDPFGTCFTASLPPHILRYLDIGMINRFLGDLGES